MGLWSLAKTVGNLTNRYLPWGGKKEIVGPQHRGEGLQFGSRVTAVQHSKLTEKLKEASRWTCLHLAEEEGLARQLAESLWQHQLNNITLLIGRQVMSFGMPGDHSLACNGLILTDVS
jgi:hypothetical protein